jgi:hypothetical protein
MMGNYVEIETESLQRLLKIKKVFKFQRFLLEKKEEECTALLKIVETYKESLEKVLRDNKKLRINAMEFVREERREEVGRLHKKIAMLTKENEYLLTKTLNGRVQSETVSRKNYS